MKLTVSVDETDILSVQNGQKAQITVSTIGDEVFSGVVTAVERSAKSSYGITSYSVEITLDKRPRMLPGMTAKALIRIEGVDNALLIPEKALRQTRDSSFVHTTYDPATGTLGGETAVIPVLPAAAWWRSPIASPKDRPCTIRRPTTPTPIITARAATRAAATRGSRRERRRRRYRRGRRRLRGTASRWKDNAMIDLHDVSRSTRSARRVHALDL